MRHEGGSSMTGATLGDVLTLTGINALLALGFYLTFASGQFSLGHGAFMAVGAYASSLLTTKLGVPLVLALPAGALAGAGSGAIVGLLAARTEGILLALLTLGVGELVRLFFSLLDYGGGVAGLRGMRGTEPALVLAAVAAVLAAIWLLMNSRWGKALEAVHQDEVGAASIGINPLAARVWAFAGGAAVAALGGAFYAHFVFFIDPSAFDFRRSVLIAMFAVLGGPHTLWGPVLGALLLTPLPEYVRFLQEWRMVLYGVAVIAMMLLRPRGILTPELLPKLGAREAAR